jgi:hypothetical protein
VPFSLARRHISLAPGNRTTVNVEPWGNQKPQIKEGQTTQWPKENGKRRNKDTQNTTQKAENQAT